VSSARWLTCPCCGYRSITATYDICDICGWEHDPAQQDHPDSDVGANPVSLRDAQRNYALYGAKTRNHLRSVRNLTPDDVRDPNWKPLEQRDPDG
jgi:methionyl-tRNA synthetase